MNYEVVIYIHGISPDEELATFSNAKEVADLSAIHDPLRKSKISHEKEYNAFKQGISRFILDESKQKAWDQAEHCFSEWGWEYQETDANNLGASHRLKDAQHQLGQRVIQAIKDTYWISLFPQKAVRKLALYGLSDAFYYVSSEGQNSIRGRIYHQIASRLRGVLDDPNASVSLTLIGHSAGSVIAFDLVSYLFTDAELFMGDLDGQARELDNNIAIRRKHRKQLSRVFSKKDAVLRESRAVVENLIRLKSMRVAKRLTLRRLITMGSPIAMMAFRSDQSIRALAYGNRVSLSSLGLAGTGGSLVNPCWVNIWNKYDPISFPVEPMVDVGHSVKDFHLRIAWNPLKIHTNYWVSKNVHQLIARLW